MTRPRVLRPPRRSRWWAPVVPIVALLVVADHRGWLLVPGPGDMHAFHGRQVQVMRVMDHASLEIDAGDPRSRREGPTRVRLWGIEPAPGSRPFLSTLEGIKPVTLVIEAHRTRDEADRLLAHVDLPDGRRLNELLLAEGLARVDERWPHADLDRYAHAETQARRMARGVWSEPAR